MRNLSPKPEKIEFLSRWGSLNGEESLRAPEVGSPRDRKLWLRSQIRHRLRLLVSEFEGKRMSAQNLAEVMMERYPEFKDFIKEKAIGEYVKSFSLKTEPFHHRLYFCEERNFAVKPGEIPQKARVRELLCHIVTENMGRWISAKRLVEDIGKLDPIYANMEAGSVAEMMKPLRLKLKPIYTTFYTCKRQYSTP